ncbi:MAG: DUF4824 family protein [Bryobacteraceae bacterium]|jgi:hypothetical protein
MKRASLFAAAAIVLIANAFALMHAWRNRSGPVAADVTLTERELAWFYNSDENDSEVALNLRWADPQSSLLGKPQMPWLDQKTLRELGFDTAVPPSDDAVPEFYARQRARRAFVALEYNGQAWRNWIENLEEQARQHPALPRANGLENQRESATRLIAIDASNNATRLRASHPDRNSVIIIPAVIRIAAGPFYFAAGQNRSEKPRQLVGTIQDIPSSIHVPLPFSVGFRRLRVDRKNAKYRVHLRYGASLEPWIVGVEFPSSATPD